MTKLLRCACFRAVPLLALAAPLGAQSVYIDCGSGSGTPSSTYGAAAGVPGVWNDLPSNSTVPLVDIAGAPTAAQAITAGCDYGTENFPTTNGDDEALLDDWNYVDCYADPHTMTITGLLAGTYVVHLYPVGGGGGANFGANVSPGGTIEGDAGGSTVGAGPFPGSFADWGVATRVVHVANDGDAIGFGFIGSVIAGAQLVHVADGQTYCDGSLGDCPCGVGAPGRGCPSTLSASGARLSASGARSVAGDSLVLTAQSVTNTVVTFFQGAATLGNGRGVAFGDGLRCAGGANVRIASRQAIGNVATYPGPGDVPISVRGQIPPTGGFRVYQVWYRNAPDYCTIATYNLTSAVAVDWLP